MTLANPNPPRTAASDDTKADVEAHAYTWIHPDLADYVQADRWAPLDPERGRRGCGGRQRLSVHRQLRWRPRQDSNLRPSA